MADHSWRRFAVNQRFHWAARVAAGIYRNACSGKLVRSLNPLEWDDDNRDPPNACENCVELGDMCDGKMPRLTREGRRVDGR